MSVTNFMAIHPNPAQRPTYRPTLLSIEPCCYHPWKHQLVFYLFIYQLTYLFDSFHHFLITMRIIDKTPWLMMIVTQVSPRHFRRLWSVWKNVRAMPLANQKWASLLPAHQSFPLPPTELSGLSGLPHADTPAAPLHWHSLSHNPFHYALSAHPLTPPVHLHAVSAQ